jgi:hypothetical protein
VALALTQPLTEMSTRNLPGGKGRLSREADLTAICKPIFWKIWEARLFIRRRSWLYTQLHVHRWSNFVVANLPRPLQRAVTAVQISWRFLITSSSSVLPACQLVYPDRCVVSAREANELPPAHKLLNKALHTGACLWLHCPQPLASALKPPVHASSDFMAESWRLMQCLVCAWRNDKLNRNCMKFEAFTANNYTKIFWKDQPCQCLVRNRRFRDLRLTHDVKEICYWCIYIYHFLGIVTV